MIGLVRSLRLGALALGLLAVSACACHRNPQASTPNWTVYNSREFAAPVYDASVDAVCMPPVGWTRKPLITTADHSDQIWLSPTGATAYGVIHFSMPLPAGLNLALAGFLNQMKKNKGEAVLLERQEDPTLPGIRFVAEDFTHVIHANLLVEGWEGWAVYAGTLRGGPINRDELDIAVRAREHTRVGRPESAEN